MGVNAHCFFRSTLLSHQGDFAFYMPEQKLVLKVSIVLCLYLLHHLSPLIMHTPSSYVASTTCSSAGNHVFSNPDILATCNNVQQISH